MFGDLNGLQKFIKEQLEPKVLEAASQVYTQSGTRAGGTFDLQPVNARAISDIGAPTGIRGVEVSVSVSARF